MTRRPGAPHPGREQGGRLRPPSWPLDAYAAWRGAAWRGAA
ncbi:hypothetical protein V7968_03325 [Nocardia vulneris]